MMMPSASNRSPIVSQLQKEIFLLQGFKPCNKEVQMALGPIKDALPNGTFPLAAIHEFYAAGASEAAATSGFMTALLAPLISNGGVCLWISHSRNLFPPALKFFGIEPDKIIFIDVLSEQHVAWAMEEALKCAALTVVVGEMKEITFTESRRLQLAVEQSQGTGFILRKSPRKQNTTAAVSRWQISTIPSYNVGSLPGIGFPQWKVELLRIRNGRPRTWEVKWEAGRLVASHNLSKDITEHDRLVQTTNFGLTATGKKVG